MDEKLKNAMDEFITKRMNDLDFDSPRTVTEAISNFKQRAEALSVVLTDEQWDLWLALENAQSLQTGKETRYYYKSGFVDAFGFLLGLDDL